MAIDILKNRELYDRLCTPFVIHIVEGDISIGNKIKYKEPNLLCIIGVSGCVYHATEAHAMVYIETL